MIVDVIHPWTKEVQSLPVESISERFVSVRWGISGIYDIALANGEIRARSLKARRKGRCLWITKDLEKLKRLVYDALHPDEKERVENSFDSHLKTMPK